MKALIPIWFLAAAAAAGCGEMNMAKSSGRPAPADRQDAGQFILSFQAPTRGNRFRVNSPDTAQGRFADRWEAKQTGRMRIELADDLSDVTAAALYLELWGGHPGVRDKRFTLNDQRTYPLPEVGAAEDNCTYSYPTVPLKRADLRTGPNTLQFTCEKGSTFWGHYLIRAAAIQLSVGRDHSRIANATLSNFHATIRATPGPDETIRLALDCPPALAERIAAVEYQARYAGYDENGNRDGEDWHGFTHDHQPVAIAGLGKPPGFATHWDLSMVPDQRGMAVRAQVRFRDLPGVVYLTPALEGLSTPERPERVSLASAEDLPSPFWSRADRKPSCAIPIDVDPADIRRAQLHIVVWEGGRGDVEHPLSLNGHDLPTPAWKGRHEPIYTVLEIDPALLRRGENRVQTHSDTHHHGIEVCLPGPALMIRATPKSHQTSQRGQGAAGRDRL